MKLNLLAAGLLLLLSLSCTSEKYDVKPGDDQVFELRTAAGDFMGRLKKILINKMQNEGVIKAVNVCSDSALLITSNIGNEMGLIIRRVSTKNRNPQNSPDEFEKNTLDEFERLHKEGKLDAAVERAVVTQYEGKKAIRYIKPILTGTECLTCHGSQEMIPDAVKTLITEKYPGDRARGFSAGDLRGAVSVIKIISNNR